jgi:hypothetical protein
MDERRRTGRGDEHVIFALTDGMQCITRNYMKELTHQIVARIPTGLHEKLRQHARTAGRRRSEIVRLALEAYLRSPEEPVKDRIGHLLGSIAGGPSDLSTNRKRLIRAFRDRR